MKRWIILLFLCTVSIVCTACDDVRFYSELDKRVFEYVLRDTEKGELEVDALNVYFHENDYYYHIEYSHMENGEWKQWDVVYRGRRYGSVTMYYNLNWENDSIILPYKDDFYDAVEYGIHKQYSDEEIDKYIAEYYGSV